MTKEVVTVSEDTTVEDLGRLLEENDISGAPVVNSKNQVVGIVSEGDLVSLDADIHFPHYFQFLDSVIFLESTKKFEERVRKVAASTVKEIMTEDVVTVQNDMPVHQVATIMTDKKVDRVPVLDGDALVGIITQADIVQALSGR